LLYDGAGDDDYRLDTAAAGLGEATPRDDFVKPDPFAPYMYYSRSFGFLLDCGGLDHYWRKRADSTQIPDSIAVSGALWRKPLSSQGELFGGGADFESGRVADFEAWDKK
jgi:hypothetical protein